MGKKDIVVACNWFRLAINMDEDGKRIMPEQVARAEKMVREWTPK